MAAVAHKATTIHGIQSNHADGKINTFGAGSFEWASMRCDLICMTLLFAWWFYQNYQQIRHNCYTLLLIADGEQRRIGQTPTTTVSVETITPFTPHTHTCQAAIYCRKNWINGKCSCDWYGDSWMHVYYMTWVCCSIANTRSQRMRRQNNASTLCAWRANARWSRRSASKGSDGAPKTLLIGKEWI